MEHTISKSQCVKGLQCPKALWLYRHREDLASEPTQAKQALFDTGYEVGSLARHYFSDGIEVTNEYFDINGAAQSTQQYIGDGHDLIFEATSIDPTHGCYARIDILKRVADSDEWDLIEVKSSTKVKDYHINDMAFQYYVFHSAGYKIRKCFMMLLDNSYVRENEIDPQGIFKLEEISDSVLDKQKEIGKSVVQFIALIKEQTEPNVPIGARCFNPFECDYKKHCWTHVPEYSVYDIFPKPKAEDISRQHGVDIRQLPDNMKPTGKKALDVQSYIDDEMLIDASAISNFLKQIKYPIYYLDYETIAPAIPIYNGTRPYQQIPFQFSIHIQREPNGEVTHIEFLHQEQSDPRIAFTQKLIESCGDAGTVLVYNKSFETQRNNELAEEFPDYAPALENINNRMIDMFVPFNKRWLYHPSQNGSASIKVVLPCFTGLSYDDLEISEGGDAMLQYENFIANKIPENDLDTLWQNLKRYCKLDTYGMVELLNVLHKHSAENK